MSPQVFQILLSLSAHELHGYAIITDVAARTGGEMLLTASTLYAALRRLLESGWIEELDERPTHVSGEDARRRFYRITDRGLAAGRTEAARLESLTAMARAARWLPKSR